MNFFRINLNKLEDPSLKRRRERRLLAAGLGVFCCAAVLCFFVARIRLDLGGQQGALRRLTGDLRAQIESLEKSENHIGERDVRELYRLDKTRVFWTGKFERLSGMAGRDIAITNLKFVQNKLSLRGIARADKSQNNFNLISDFIEKLKAERAFSSDFQRIEFTSSARVNFLGQDILNFEVLCLPK